MDSETAGEIMLRGLPCSSSTHSGTGGRIFDYDYDYDYEFPMNLRFTTNDENGEAAMRKRRAVAATGRGRLAGTPR